MDDNDKLSQSCRICGISENPIKMLICDLCEEAFHASCCKSEVKVLSLDKWHCRPYLKRKRKTLWKKHTGKSFEIKNRKRLWHVESHVSLMLKDVLPYTSKVRIGKEFQAEILDSSGPIQERKFLGILVMKRISKNYFSKRPRNVFQICFLKQGRRVRGLLGWGRRHGGIYILCGMVKTLRRSQPKTRPIGLQVEVEQSTPQAARLIFGVALKMYVDPAELFKTTHTKKSGDWVDERSRSTYRQYHDCMMEIKTQIGDSSTEGGHEVDGATKLELWKEVAGGKKRGMRYGTADLSSNLRRGLSSLTQESRAPSSISDGYEKATENALLRQEVTAAHQEVAEANQLYVNLEEQFRALMDRMTALERQSVGASTSAS